MTLGKAGYGLLEAVNGHLKSVVVRHYGGRSNQVDRKCYYTTATEINFFIIIPCLLFHY